MMVLVWVAGQEQGQGDEVDGVVLFLFLWVDYLTETNKTGVWVLWEVGFGVCWAWVGVQYLVDQFFFLVLDLVWVNLLKGVVWLQQ